MKRISILVAGAFACFFTSLAQTDAPRQPLESIRLVIEFSGENVEVLEASIIEGGNRSQKSLRTVNGRFRVEELGGSGEVLLGRPFSDPRIHVAHSVDLATGLLSGTLAQLPREIAVVTVPKVPGAAGLRVVAPNGFPLLQLDISSLERKRFRKSGNALWLAEPVMVTGEHENRIDLLVMGDGYTESDTGRFRNDVSSVLIQPMFGAKSPFREYAGFFNVYMVTVISNERGADHPDAGIVRDTELDASYGLPPLERLLTCNTQKVLAVADEAFPQYDHIMVLVNDSTYGGSGGQIAVSANTVLPDEVLIHEFGHSFANLLDEYLVTNSPVAAVGPNCDQNESSPLWKHWIQAGSPGVGAFPGCWAPNLFRPTFENCIMKSLLLPFCVVCREHITRAINEAVELYDSYTIPPSMNVQAGDSAGLSVELMRPADHALTATWSVDGIVQKSDTTGRFTYLPLDSGGHRVTAVIRDPGGFVLADPAGSMTESIEWVFQVTGSVVRSFALKQNYPNPFNPGTTIVLDVPKAAHVRLAVYDLLGRQIEVLIDDDLPAGPYSREWDATGSPSGVYFYRMEAGEFVETRKMLVAR